MSSSASAPPPRLISDELWALVEPLIPPRKPAVHGRTGRPRTSDRDVLEGIAFVLFTGIGWADHLIQRWAPTSTSRGST
ncbi:transposase [Geodermatophilus sp. SYSU D00814]